MTKVILEDEYFPDPRFNYLGKVLNIDKYAAQGRVTHLWKHCLDHKKEVLSANEINTYSEWFNDNDKCFAEAMTKAHLAERTDNGDYRIKGIKERFGYLKDRRAAAKKGGEVKKLLSGMPLASQTLDKVPDDVSLTDDQKMKIFVGKYVKAYEKEYKTRPYLGGKTLGEMRRFVVTHDLQQACDLIEAYVQMPDDWFKTKMHDFTTFISNLPKVSVALATGKASPGVKSTLDVLKERGVSGDDGSSVLKGA